VHNVKREYQAQETITRFRPIERWIPDSREYKTYNIPRNVIGNTGEGQFRFDFLQDQPDSAWIPMELPPALRCRWYPEYLPINEESCIQQGEQTYRRASKSNHHHALWLAPDGTEMAKDIPGIPSAEKKAVYDRIRNRWEKKKSSRSYVDDYSKFVNMRNMQDQTCSETEDTYRRFKLVQPKSTASAVARPPSPPRLPSPPPPPPTPPIDSETEASEDESKLGAVGGVKSKKQTRKQKKKK